jgi:hypothetical protein
MEAIHSSETSVLTKATQRYIPENDILQGEVYRQTEEAVFDDREHNRRIVFEREQASVYLLYMRDVVGEVVA